MSTISTDTALNRLFISLQEHYNDNPGNVVNLVTVTREQGDADLGIGGTPNETFTLLIPEPVFSSIQVKAVQESDGALRYSDEVMSVARSAIDDSIAFTTNLLWDVNGVRYITKQVQGTQVSWAFTIRRVAE